MRLVETLRSHAIRSLYVSIAAAGFAASLVAVSVAALKKPGNADAVGYLVSAAPPTHAQLYDLGMAQRTGIGAARDPKRGFDTLKRAAAEGSSDAMLELGLAYAGGVTSARVQGYAWLLQAEYLMQSSNPAKAITARKKIEVLDRFLSPQQIEKATTEARKAILAAEGRR